MPSFTPELCSSIVCRYGINIRSPFDLHLTSKSMLTLEWWISIQMHNSRKFFNGNRSWYQMPVCQAGEVFWRKSQFRYVVVSSGSCHSTSCNIQVFGWLSYVYLPTGLPFMVHLDKFHNCGIQKAMLVLGRTSHSHVSPLRRTHSWCEKLVGGFSQLAAAESGRMGSSTKGFCINFVCHGGC